MRRFGTQIPDDEENWCTQDIRFRSQYNRSPRNSPPNQNFSKKTRTSPNSWRSNPEYRKKSLQLAPKD